MKKILNINSNYQISGCTLYRNIIPYEALSGRGWEIEFLPVKKIDQDIVVFNRGFQKGILEWLPRLRERGMKVIYEFDDLLDKVPAYNNYAASNWKEIAYTHMELISQADMVTTTTEYLKEVSKNKTSAPIHVIPNAVRQITPRDGGDKIRIGYAGGSSHYIDLNFILDVIIALQKKYDFEFVTLGVSRNPVFEQEYKNYPQVYKPYSDAMEKLKQVKNYTSHPFVKPWDYQEYLRKLNLTVGLCPLIGRDDFNKAKSAIKFYEYASVITTTLASDCLAYADCNYVAKSYADWYNKLEKLIINKKFRNDILREQTKYVAENRVIDVVVDKWDKAFSSCLKSPSGR